MTNILIVLVVLLSLLLGGCVWYIRGLLKPLKYIFENSDATAGLLEEYERHLERVYGMETFYGDDTLKGLLEHTSFLKEQVATYRTMFSFEDNEEN